ncbi:hypothetical protein P5673_019933 [Acropora cervicornis]|uniref:Uncharacterized protein n=1 Tax=Acropora cervicornis TaxID=6130 RepID=A0AAD9V1N4_ACRCE|nr:hypothetical protein P5673_019933 [Acropora cervicornis]
MVLLVQTACKFTIKQSLDQQSIITLYKIIAKKKLTWVQPCRDLKKNIWPLLNAPIHLTHIFLQTGHKKDDRCTVLYEKSTPNTGTAEQ